MRICFLSMTRSAKMPKVQLTEDRLVEGRWEGGVEMG